MVEVVVSFFTTFGLIFVLYYLVWKFLDKEVVEDNMTDWKIAQDLFFAFNGGSVIYKFNNQLGFFFFTSYLYLV